MLRLLALFHITVVLTRVLVLLLLCHYQYLCTGTSTTLQWYLYSCAYFYIHKIFKNGLVTGGTDSMYVGRKCPYINRHGRIFMSCAYAAVDAKMRQYSYTCTMLLPTFHSRGVGFLCVVCTVLPVS